MQPQLRLLLFLQRRRRQLQGALGVHINDTVALLVQRLREFSREYELQRIAIHLHGGEPLLMPKAGFDSICEEIRSNLAPFVDLSMTIQTNGMLIDLEWIEIFNRHGLQVGVSLDGAQAHNDAHRLDHHGRSSYKATVRGLALCQEHLHQPPVISGRNRGGIRSRENLRALPK